jgi:hypothetical protein
MVMSDAEARMEEATQEQHSGGLKIFCGNGNMLDVPLDAYTADVVTWPWI